MQKLILLILVVLSIPVITFAHDVNPHDDLIIRMTKNGFEPKELTVTEGDEVLFINNDDTDHWPASNFHPTHTLYPEFDPLKGIHPGGSWKFKFEKVGTWRMHDHLSPHITGTIIVLKDLGKTVIREDASSTPANDTANTNFFRKIINFLNQLWHKIFSINTDVNSKLLTEFKSQDEKAKYTWLENIAKRDGPEVAWRYIKATYNTPDGVVGNPHDMAHLVGQLIYKTYGFKGLPICEPIFAFGCYHGLMEVAFDKNKPEEYADKILSAEDGCSILGDTETPSYWSCIHGMGHGIATFREYNIDKALKDCDSLAEKVRTYCHDGVFMEFSVSAPPNFYIKDNPIYPCDVIAQNYKKSCARYQPQVMRMRFNMDTDAIALVCTNTTNNDIIYNCTDALGYFIAQTSGGKTSKIVAGCNDIENKKAAAQCAAAAAGELVFQDYVGWRESTKEICASLSGEYQVSCSKRVEQVKQSYGRK